MSDDPTEVVARISPDSDEKYGQPLVYEYKPHRQIDVRYWLKLAVYSCIGILLALGVIIAVALTMMILRYINSKPS